jgi:hypothetical protein
MRKLTIFGEDADYAVLDTAFKKAGIDFERVKLATLSAVSGDRIVLWVTLANAALNAAAVILVAFAKRNKKVLVKCGDREVEVVNYSTTKEVAEILRMAQEVVLSDYPKAKLQARAKRAKGQIGAKKGKHRGPMGKPIPC